MKVVLTLSLVYSCPRKPPERGALCLHRHAVVCFKLNRIHRYLLVSKGVRHPCSVLVGLLFLVDGNSIRGECIVKDAGSAYLRPLGDSQSPCRPNNDQGRNSRVFPTSYRSACSCNVVDIRDLLLCLIPLCNETIKPFGPLVAHHLLGRSMAYVQLLRAVSLYEESPRQLIHNLTVITRFGSQFHQRSQCLRFLQLA